VNIGDEWNHRDTEAQRRRDDGRGKGKKEEEVGREKKRTHERMEKIKKSIRN
jgi:hypothetical protein